MVTKKKKTEKTISTDTEKKKKIQKVWPEVIVGNHLTVKKYEDGYTELTWDDEALLREVQEATK